MNHATSRQTSSQHRRGKAGGVGRRDGFGDAGDEAGRRDGSETQVTKRGDEMVRSWGRVAHMITVSSHDVRRVPKGCVYADRCVYAPDAAFTRMCLYAVFGAFTPASGCVYASGTGAYTQWVHIHICVRVSTQVSAYKCTPDRVNAGIDEP